MMAAMVPIEAFSELASRGSVEALVCRWAAFGDAFSRIRRLRALICAAAIAAVVTPSLAQKTSHSTGGGGSQPPLTSTQPMSPLQTAEQPDPFITVNLTTPGVITVTPDSARTVEAEACNSWTDSGMHSPTVSVARLGVPDKASSEFQKACSSYKNKKYTDAEGHARRALDLYPDYAASWVLLGQVLDAQHHQEEAGQACSQAATVDPKYIAPYLCLAEFAARSEDWKQVSHLSDQALSIDPTSNAYALYYSAAASFHLQQLPDAEQHARAAVDLDPWHRLPQVHLLLANIYATKGDPHSEATELKEYLKIASSSPDAAGARSMLKELENPPAK
jgi:tetratricopeptide (TPR) repeat protein